MAEKLVITRLPQDVVFQSTLPDQAASHGVYHPLQKTHSPKWILLGPTTIGKDHICVLPASLHLIHKNRMTHPGMFLEHTQILYNPNPNGLRWMYFVSPKR